MGTSLRLGSRPREAVIPGLLLGAPFQEQPVDCHSTQLRVGWPWGAFQGAPSRKPQWGESPEAFGFLGTNPRDRKIEPSPWRSDLLPQSVSIDQAIKDDEERRANFKSRHNCDEKTDKTTPGFWSCDWSW
jgi:hypothetical protein